MDDSFRSGSEHDSHEEDDEGEEYDESEGKSQLLGFMFGNVGYSGDLDADYLDEDAKEHLAALADKLGPSLADIDLTKSPSSSTAVSEQDYDEKAENAVDYEDIDEQYEGPEVDTINSEVDLLSSNENFSIDLSSNTKVSIFGDEDYDEEEAPAEVNNSEGHTSEPQSIVTAGQKLDESADEDGCTNGNLNSNASTESLQSTYDTEDIEEEFSLMQEDSSSEPEVSLPVLCVEDGTIILRFSEIFGVHEPLKKKERRDQLPYHTSRGSDEDRFNVEDDETDILKSFDENILWSQHPTLLKDDYLQVNDRVAETSLHDNGPRKDFCLPGQPMKEDTDFDISTTYQLHACTTIYPLDQQDWEDEIIWGSSPPSKVPREERMPLESDSEDKCNADEEIGKSNRKSNSSLEPELLDEDNLFASIPKTNALVQHEKRSYHPQMLRLGNVKGREWVPTSINSSDATGDSFRGSILHRFTRLSFQNKELLDGSWLDNVIWDPDEPTSKPKLILDLQDDKMLFEILEHKEEQLPFHASAMLINHLQKPLSNDAGAHSARFNISNDKYYSSRKSSQQLKAHAKKRASYGLKIMHSVPALKLQNMKPTLSNKDVANFHRPKALWFPHQNKVAEKLQGDLCNEGSFKIILKTLPGRLTMFRVEARELVSGLLIKASKKLDFNITTRARLYYHGRELEMGKSLVEQNVRPNSILYLVHSTIELWPRAEKLPSDNKPLRPPGAFKKKADLSVKDGHVFLVEYCEERPLLLGNVGMGARLCTYYQKSSPGDQTAASLRNGRSGIGNIFALDASDKSPFLGEINSGCCQSSLETNMYRSPIFHHELASTDFLLVRSASGTLSLRRINKIFAAGQQEPHMEVMAPGTKSAQNHLWNRLLVYVYREFRAKEKRGSPYILADELLSHFPTLAESFLRKRLKQCADLQRSQKGHLFWALKNTFRLPSEEELRRMVTPENVCSYESMLTGVHRLKCLGIKQLTAPVGLSAAMNRLPDEAIALAAASHIERELQITPWSLSSNFVACTNQDKENIERLEITGVGDPSGRGLGFSYVRVAPKAAGTNSAKKKTSAARGSTTVTGTDADLRRLSMDAAREVLVKFNVPEDHIGKMTRWHRIAMIRKLSSEQAASGIKVDATALSKFARGQRMSFVQLQQQTREKCQEIWDRQIQSLSAGGTDENESDSEANSDLDSFAGDLENLLDAEEYEDGEENKLESRSDKTEGVKGLKMRRDPSQAQTEEEIEEDEMETASIHRLLDGIESKIKKLKKQPPQNEAKLGSGGADTVKKTNNIVGQGTNLAKCDVPFAPTDLMKQDTKEDESLSTEKSVPTKAKLKKGNEKSDIVISATTKKQIKIAKDMLKAVKDKKPFDKPVRENFVCGACGQLGHMRTNKHCPKYKEGLDPSELEVTTHVPSKTPNKKLGQKSIVTEPAAAIHPERSEKTAAKLQPKVHTFKVKYGPADQNIDKNLQAVPSSSKQNPLPVPDAEETKSGSRFNRIVISSKKKPENTRHEVQKPSVVIRLPASVEADKDPPRKKIIIKQSRSITHMEQVGQSNVVGTDKESRKMKKIAELAMMEEQRLQDQWIAEEKIRRQVAQSRVWEEEKRNNKIRIAEEKSRRIMEERRIEEQKKQYEMRMLESQRQEVEHKKSKKKKNKKLDFKDEYPGEYRSNTKDRIAESGRSTKRRSVLNLGRQSADYGPPLKRRKGGEVLLSNTLEEVVDKLREKTEVSYLFLKPVTKKEAPDYFDIIERPMDLATIKEKVRRMEYKDREEFRHDMYQITYNAHLYNDGRNPGIPPLADQLLELCDYLLLQYHHALNDAEAGIESREG